MSKSSHIHVRPLELGDFDFVRSLAAQQPNFTVPAPYVLWLLLRIKDAVCLVAEHSSEGPLAYMLAVPIEGPDNTLHVWQFAVTATGAQLHAAADLLGEFYGFVRRLGVRTIAFSSVAGSPEYRAIRKAIWEMSAAKPQLVGVVPRSVSRTQTEYRIHLQPW